MDAIFFYRMCINQIGLVSQEPVLFSGTIYENIAYGKEDVTEEEIEAAGWLFIWFWNISPS